MKQTPRYSCDRCGKFRYYAQVICPRCGGSVNQPLKSA